jgi:hypothetical protein
MIGISMIHAAGLVKCVEGLYHATTSPQRYWIPQVLLWSTFIYGVVFLWAYKDNLSDQPSFIFYASSIAASASIFLRAHIFATNDAAQIQDWAVHFDETARRYFVVAGLTSLFMLLAAWASGETTGFDSVAIGFWIGVGLQAVGAISEKRQVRGTVAVTTLVLLLLTAYRNFSNDLI